MHHPDYSSLVNSQREYFLPGCTRSSLWRRAQLEAFKAMFTENHDELCDALWKDRRRNVVDADLMDVAYNVNEGNRWRHLLLVVLSGLLLNAGSSQTAATAQAAPALTIKNIGPGVVAIDGDWQFHLGDDMHWIDPAYDDSQWEPIKGDKSWGEQTHPGYAGFAWYRRHLDIAPPISGRQKLTILMPPVIVSGLAENTNSILL